MKFDQHDLSRTRGEAKIRIVLKGAAELVRFEREKDNKMVDVLLS
jgi:hypothetical protein